MSLPRFRAWRPGAVLAQVGVCAALAALPAASAPAASAPILQSPATPAEASPQEVTPSDSVLEEHLRQMLVGKSIYLRGGYLDNNLSFNEYGGLIGHSPHGSFTLNLLQIDKLHLEKRKLQLEGVRYGLHFLGATPNEDPTKAVDRVRITPKKKIVRITIDRELVVKPKKKKSKDKDDKEQPAPPAPAATDNQTTDADEASATSGEVPTGDRGVTTTTSPAHALKLLNGAVGNVFSIGLDDRLIAGMPDFWKLYYKSVADHTNFQPTASGVLFDNNVDQKARLLSNIEAPSNEYAQTGGVAGMALYHAVIGADGKPAEIVVSRPIGFGLDENAVDTIRKAEFQPAIKDGKPVPVMLDLVVQFRIFSKRTSVEGEPESAAAPSGSILPGPYSAGHQ